MIYSGERNRPEPAEQEPVSKVTVNMNSSAKSATITAAANVVYVSTLFCLLIPYAGSSQNMCTDSPEPVLSTGPEAVAENGNFYEPVRLSPPGSLSATSSPELIHVAVILQVLVGRDFKAGFRTKADTMLSTLLRQFTGMASHIWMVLSLPLVLCFAVLLHRYIFRKNKSYIRVYTEATQKYFANVLLYKNLKEKWQVKYKLLFKIPNRSPRVVTK